MTGTILVLGGEGMLGHKMFQVLSARFGDVRCTIRGRASEGPLARIDLFRGGGVVEQVDVLESGRLEAVVRGLTPSVVVNCVGIIKQRPEAKDAITSIAINSLLPHQLAVMVEEWGGRLVHFSTDCVFNGRRGHYTEDDPSDAEDLYGRTKYLGEVHAANALTLRTSIVGRELSEHRSLLDWFLRQNHGRVSGFTRHLYSGVTTNHLAGLVGDLIEQSAGLSGLFQVTGTTISKHDLLVALRDAYRLDVEIVPDDTAFCDRSMVGDKFFRATGRTAPTWDVLVRELASDTTPYDEWVANEAV